MDSSANDVPKVAETEDDEAWPEGAVPCDFCDDPILPGQDAMYAQRGQVHTTCYAEAEEELDRMNREGPRPRHCPTCTCEGTEGDANVRM
jgi:ribosomal protein L24E